MFEIRLGDKGEVVCEGRLDASQAGKAQAFLDALAAPDVVDMAAGLKARTRGHADRRVAIGIGEPHPARREMVKMGRSDHGVPVTAEHPFVVLVRHDEKKICWFH